MRPPLALGHIALSVPDLDAGIEWYGDLFGFQPIAPAQLVDVRGGHFGTLVSDVFGPRLGAFRLVHLHTASGTAVEMFQFIEPAFERRDEVFEYWKGGYSHLCVIDPDIEGLTQRIIDRGGRMRTSQIWPLFEGEPYRIAYCEDPWGSVIEIYTHSHEQTFANRETYD
jgi:catechol 2,3-dioxygenase-like lactoylglutathione lyase family enzyme